MNRKLLNILCIIVISMNVLGFALALIPDFSSIYGAAIVIASYILAIILAIYAIHRK